MGGTPCKQVGLDSLKQVDKCGSGSKQISGIPLWSLFESSLRSCLGFLDDEPLSQDELVLLPSCFRLLFHYNNKRADRDSTLNCEELGVGVFFARERR